MALHPTAYPNNGRAVMRPDRWPRLREAVILRPENARVLRARAWQDARLRINRPMT